MNKRRNRKKAKKTKKIITQRGLSINLKKNNKILKITDKNKNKKLKNKTIKLI